MKSKTKPSKISQKKESVIDSRGTSILKICGGLGFGTLALLPSKNFWEWAQALAERGIYEEVVVEKVYEVEEASGADYTGKVSIITYTDFRFGPNKEFEKSLKMGAYEVGEVFEFVYESENHRNFVVEPKGRSAPLLYLSQWGVGLRAAIAAFGLLFYLIAILNFIELFRLPKTKRSLSDAA